MNQCITAIRLLAVLVTIGASLNAAEAVHVRSHDRELVVTDPGTGERFYPRWAQFPAAPTEYRKVLLAITYRCPDGKRCGEWDYIDNVYLTRTGGMAGKAHRFELARMISPYGWQFDSSWYFTWKTDITDFGFLLHDSCEITFRHSGYESNTDRGWLVSLDFELTEGRPPQQVLAVDTLWHGSFMYGDRSQPIESLVQSRTIAHPKAKVARVRLLQTGHGMDATENCAEFCSKWRQLLLDDSLVAQDQLWKVCGDNPVYPQAGTWIFDRANWCPGDVVEPSIHSIPIKPGKRHQLRMQMEPYQAAEPSANWSISGYVFYCTKPLLKRDLAIEEILVPSSDQRFARLNPQCQHLLLRISNNGSEPITRFQVRHFLQGTAQQSTTIAADAPLHLNRHTWNGVLAPGERMDLPLQSSLPMTDTSLVVISDINGRPDEQSADNVMVIAPPTGMPIYRSPLILQLKTNRAPLDNLITLADADGKTVHQLQPTAADTNRLYCDTLNFSPGCYSLRTADTAGDGLGFWFNAEAGYGYVRLLDGDGRLLKGFSPDFGSSLMHSFSVTGDDSRTSPHDSALQVIVFPPRNFGTFDLDLFASWPTDLTIEIISDSGRTVFLEQLSQVDQLTKSLDITAQPDGVYFVRIQTAGETIVRRIRVKRS